MGYLLLNNRQPFPPFPDSEYTYLTNEKRHQTQTMSQSRLYTLEGLVLRRRDHREADRILTLLTPQGRVDLIAPGVRKPRSRKAGHVELFCRTRLLVARARQGWDVISQAELVDANLPLREDFLRGTWARYLAELLLRFFDEATDLALYELAVQGFALLATASDPARAAQWLTLRLLDLAGFRPECFLCVGEWDGAPCQAALRPRPTDAPYGLDAERGGALCPRCYAAHRLERGVREISPSALSWLQAMQRRPYEELAALVMSPATAGELRHIMDALVTYHLERHPLTLHVLEEGGPP